MKTIFLISGIRFTYKFVIPDTKRRQKFFLEFLKYWPSSHGSNKLVIKAKVHAKTFFKCFCFMHKKDNMIFFCYRKIRCDDFFFIFERLGRMHENKIYFFGFIIVLQCFDENHVF